MTNKVVVHNGELYSLYSSPNIKVFKSRGDELSGGCSMHGRD
jgi:hypothetical protein